MKSGITSLWLLIIFICHIPNEGIAKNESITSESANRNDSQLPAGGWMLHNPGGGPLDSRCPCLTRDICPRTFGASPVDILLLGQLPICQDESKVRCCGVSVRVITQKIVRGNKKKQAAVNLTDSLRPLNDPKEVPSIQGITSNDTKLKLRGKSADEMAIIKEKKNEDLTTHQPQDKVTVNLSASNETESIISKQATFVNDTELKPSGGSADVDVITKFNNNVNVMTKKVEHLNTRAHLMKSDEKSNTKDMETTTIGMNDSEHLVNALELKRESSDLNGDDILSEHNVTNSSTAVYTEYFKPEMLMFHDDVVGVMEETKSGSLMIVTPIPMSPMQKYQQQTLNKGSRSNVTNDNIAAASHLILRGLMHVTHKPDKEVMIVTPQPMTPLMEKGENQTSRSEKNSTNTEDNMIKSAVHEFSSPSGHSPGLRQFNSSQISFRTEGKQENIDYIKQDESFGKRIIPKTEILEELLTSDLSKMERHLSKSSIKVNTSSGKHLKEKEREGQDHNFGSIPENSTTTTPLINVESIPSSKQTLLKDIEEMLSTSNFSSQPLMDNKNYMEILRIVRESQILGNSAHRPLQSRRTARPRWSPLRTRKKQPEISNFRNPMQVSFSSQMKDKNHNRTGLDHKLKNKDENLVARLGNITEVTTEKMKIVENKTSRNRSNSSVLQMVTENVRQITKLPKSQMIPMTQIAAPDVAITTGHLQVPTKSAFVNHKGSPTTNLRVPQQNKSLSKELEGQKIRMNNPMQIVNANMGSNKEQDGLVFLQQELLSLFSDLKMWERKNANLPLENNPSNTHKNPPLLKKENITPITFRDQEVQENLKPIIPNDEDFGRRIIPRHTISANPSRSHVIPPTFRKP